MAGHDALLFAFSAKSDCAALIPLRNGLIIGILFALLCSSIRSPKQRNSPHARPPG